MGKEGIQIVTQVFTDKGINEEDAPGIAKYYLEIYRFIYAYPDDNVSPVSFSNICSHVSLLLQKAKGTFGSAFVSLALAAHLKMTIRNVHLDDEGYGYPIGGLAVATAVVSSYVFTMTSFIDPYSF